MVKYWVPDSALFRFSVLGVALFDDQTFDPISIEPFPFKALNQLQQPVLNLKGEPIKGSKFLRGNLTSRAVPMKPPDAFPKRAEGYVKKV